MVRNTRDPQWREMRKRRQGPLEYRLFRDHDTWYFLVTDGGREVESRLLPSLYVPIVKNLLNALQSLYKQKIKDLTPYQLGLCAYLSQVRLNLRYELPLKPPAHPSSWRSRVLNGYLHREHWGFSHDDDGREKYERMCEQKRIMAYIGEPWEEAACTANGVNFPDLTTPALSALQETTQSNQVPFIQQRAELPSLFVATSTEGGAVAGLVTASGLSTVPFGGAGSEFGRPPENHSGDPASELGRVPDIMDIDDENGAGLCDDDFGPAGIGDASGKAAAAPRDADDGAAGGPTATLGNGNGRDIDQTTGLGSDTARSSLSSIDARSLDGSPRAGRKGSPLIGNLFHREEVARKKQSEAVDAARKQRTKKSKKRKRGTKKNVRKAGAAVSDPGPACVQGTSLPATIPSGSMPAALQGPRPRAPSGPTIGVMQGSPVPALKPSGPRPAGRQHSLTSPSVEEFQAN